ncbi:MAG: hypothetical protein A2W18_09845 [Candidatus Muproteobacteria bacterium RBG_16_60_9]|uniref:Uncharacterized protein n=1 Tax=Candidatus Muproteobacteria bacterium RBG_16_60_9 TaxID=1817755 RepID=A0A1F6VAH5_9PROT|nr:MAG: hypothetical protein A2W18_09845 [Candidatus Muproteobacteria bacterium RBG_16_60_9]
MKPVRGADRKSAPETEDTDGLWLGEGPKPEKRRHRLRHRGGVVLFAYFLLDKQEKVRRPRFGNGK